jgi:lipid II:glycine glycyltransferase (peptidoglycan interpeptide bridge formation enzyme)
MGLHSEPFQGDGAAWNARIARLPGAHLLQTWEWAHVKAQYGWQTRPVVWWQGESSPREDTAASPAAMAMILKRQVHVRGLPTPISVMYAPKGPLLAWSDPRTRQAVLGDLQAMARLERSAFVKIDPDLAVSEGGITTQGERWDGDGDAVREDLQLRRWVFSDEQVQFRNTVMLDLASPEDEMLGRMKQKTRYNIRLASKKGVRVRPGVVDELPLLYRMYSETSRRDGFAIRDRAYYERVWTQFLGQPAAPDIPGAELLVAEVDGEIAAGVFVFFFAGRAYYLYGMSRAAHREKMPNYLLQWEAIKLAKRRGCRRYDLWGAPDEFNESDPLWGVYRFKEGFGGQVVRTLGAWDYPARRATYAIYTRVVPRLMRLMRWLGSRRVERDLLAA